MLSSIVFSCSEQSTRNCFDSSPIRISFVKVVTVMEKSLLKVNRHKTFQRGECAQPETRGRSAENLGELSVFRCLPMYDYHMSAADKAKHLVRLNISNVAELKATLCSPKKSPSLLKTAVRNLTQSVIQHRKQSRTKNQFKKAASGRFITIKVDESSGFPSSGRISKENYITESANAITKPKEEKGVAMPAQDMPRTARIERGLFRNDQSECNPKLFK